MKFDLSDWQGRRARLLPILEEAAQAGLVPPGGDGKLGDFLLGRGVDVAAAPPLAEPAGEGLDTRRASEPVSPVEESEAPRFIRGFHDILITIGLVVGLVGLGGLASIYAVIPAAIVLAEILVRRQRLALPAVTLTAAIGLVVAIGLMPVWEAWPEAWADWIPSVTVAVVALAGFLVYWRYKVPLALAGGLVCLYAAVVSGAAVAVGKTSGDPDFFQTHPLAVVIALAVFALLTFGTALHFDIGDRHRATRRSDVAFWMHLAAAPAILYAVMAQIYIGSKGGWFSVDTSLWQATAIVCAVLVLMLAGIVLDRRAFVTSGLLSFGYAFKVLLTEGGFSELAASTGTMASLTLLVIGVIVLSLGIGWQPLRRVIVGNLPDGLRETVPPVRA
ncbi:MAG: hypothetical protein KDJ87_06910 [Rhizobiaceae bacterium]|nr:hypothetical protein [Rhizobiaceae bacterium]